MKKISFKQEGFTLIELLIVVAIIAILAAIAIPNFLAAQTRSKVAKIKAEFNTLGTAIESYYVDENSYPIYDSTNNQNGIFGFDNFGSYRFDVLTTPVAYITSIPKDPFMDKLGQGADVAHGIGYFMYTWPEMNIYPGNVFWHAKYWALRSKGPDGQWNSYIDASDSSHYQNPWTDNASVGCIDGDVTLLTYEPSNGIISRGEIWRTGRKGQF